MSLPTSRPPGILPSVPAFQSGFSKMRRIEFVSPSRFQSRYSTAYWLGSQPAVIWISDTVSSHLHASDTNHHSHTSAPTQASNSTSHRNYSLVKNEGRTPQPPVTPRS